MLRYDTHDIREQIKKQNNQVGARLLPRLSCLTIDNECYCLFAHFIATEVGLHKIQNQPRTEPPTKPNPRNPVMTIADNSDSDKGTDLGARIIRTLVR